MRERSIEKYLVEQVQANEGKCIKLTPPPAGIPDRLILLPGWIPFFVELKAPKKKPSQIQRQFINWLTLNDFAVAVIDSTESVDKLIKQYKEKLNEQND